MRGVLASTFALLSRRARWQWAGLVVVATVNAGLEIVGAVAVYSVVTFVVDPAAAHRLALLGVVRHLYGGADERATVLALCVFLAGFYVVKNTLLAFEAYAQSRFAYDTSADLSSALLRGYLASDYALHLRRNAARLIHTMQEAVDGLCRSVLLSTTAAISGSLSILAMAAVLCLKAPLGSLAAGVLVTLALARGLRATQQAFKSWGMEARDTEVEEIGLLQQCLGGIKEIKILGREDYFIERFTRLRAGRARLHTLRVTAEAAPRLLIEALFVIGMAAFVAIAASLPPGGAGARGGTQAMVPVLGLLVYAGFRILPSAHRVVYHLHNIHFDAPLAVRVAEDLALSNAAAIPPHTPPAAPAEPRPFAGDILCDRLSFSYPEAARPALCDVDLRLVAGESIGIVGPTGSGKSTLVDLLLGLQRPTAGRVLVAGVDLGLDAAAVRAWQHQIGYVPQAVYLADDTLRRNVAFGLPDHQVDEAAVWRALRLAQLDRFVAALPTGLDTVAGERGIRLSGGERQRIAIARALYRDPRVLVLDEATAALDNRTEQRLTGAIETLRHDRTLIVVAHRLTTVRHCDRLVFLRDGRIEDIGSYEELLQRSAAFRAMALAGRGADPEPATGRAPAREVAV